MIATLLYSLSALALIISWLVPNHYQPWLGFYNESIAVFGLLVLSTWFLFRKKSDTSQIALPFAALLFLALALIPLIQSTSGIILFWGDAWISSLFLAMIGLAITIGYGTAQSNSSKISTTLAIILLLAAACSFYLALCQSLSIPLGIWILDTPPGSTPYANIGQRNMLATLFCFGLIAVLYLRECAYTGNSSTLLITLLLLLGLAITRSRTPFLIFAALTIWLLCNRISPKLKLSKIEVIGGASTFILLWFSWPKIANLLYLGAESSLERLVGSEGGDIRLMIWQQLLDAAVRHPFFGYGWNQVSLAQIAVADDYPHSVGVQFSHNIVIDFMIWNGPIMGIILALTGVWWFLCRLRSCRTKEAWFCLSILLILAVHSMLETPHTYAFFLIPAGLCIGVIEQTHGAKKINIPYLSYVVFILLGWVLFAWVSSEYLATETDYRLMRLESVKIAPKPDIPNTVKLSLLTQLREEILFRRTPPTEGMTKEKIKWMEAVSYRNASPENLSKLALAQGLNRQPNESAITLQKLHNLYGQRNLEHTNKRWSSYTCQYPFLNDIKVPWDSKKYSQKNCTQ